MAAYGAATLHEAFDRRGALPSNIKPIDPSMVCCGPAFTVRCSPGDNLMLQLAIAYAPPGSVVVLSVGGFEETGVFGDMLATASKEKGLAGFVTDSRVRDAKALRQLAFPVFAAGLCIQGAVKEAVAPLNQPVAFKGQVVNPGDVVFGDEDGLVVIPASKCEEVLKRAAERARMEKKKVLDYRAGKSVIEVNKLLSIMVQKGWSLDRHEAIVRIGSH